MARISETADERRKRRRYKSLKGKMTKMLKNEGIPQADIDLFFSDSAAGIIVRNRMGQWFIENGVSKEDVEEMFRYL